MVSQPPGAEADDVDSKYPRQLLSNEQSYFELLFNILSLQNESLVNDAWSLVQLLPTNARIEDAIMSVGSTVDEYVVWLPWSLPQT